jgi:exodeoxyribonuclease V gamma subunit
LADLHRLIAHPARGFLRQRLQVADTRGEEEPDDSLPVELDNLEQWAVGERVLGERLAGLDAQACRLLEQARGTLPPGQLGVASLRKVGRSVDALVQATLLDRVEEPAGHDVDITMPDGTRLTGTVDGVRGDVIFSISYSRLGPRHRLRAWIDLVALSAAQPGRAWRAVTVGRDGRGSQRSVFEPMSVAQAMSALHELVELYRAGLNSPLPLPIKTAEAYATARKSTRVPAARVRAEQEWVGDRFPGDRKDPEYVLIHGPEAPFTVLTSQAPLPGEGGPGWPTDETDRFGLLARRLWDRLQAAEKSVKP